MNANLCELIKRLEKIQHFKIIGLLICLVFSQCSLPARYASRPPAAIQQFRAGSDAGGRTLWFK